MVVYIFRPQKGPLRIHAPVAVVIFHAPVMPQAGPGHKIACHIQTTPRANNETASLLLNSKCSSVRRADLFMTSCMDLLDHTT